MGSQKAQKADYTLSVTGRQGAAVSIAVSGRVALDSLQALMAEVRAVLRDQAPSQVTVDLGGVTYLDSAGALACSSRISPARNPASPPMSTTSSATGETRRAAATNASNSSKL